MSEGRPARLLYLSAGDHASRADASIGLEEAASSNQMALAVAWPIAVLSNTHAQTPFSPT